VAKTTQVERILQASTQYVPDPFNNPDTFASLNDAIKEQFLAKAEELASQGLRVISFASRTLHVNDIEGITREDTEKNFVFLGLAGIFDPPRPETLGAVRACKQAGIIVHMFVIISLVSSPTKAF